VSSEAHEGASVADVYQETPKASPELDDRIPCVRGCRAYQGGSSNTCGGDIVASRRINLYVAVRPLTTDRAGGITKLGSDQNGRGSVKYIQVGRLAPSGCYCLDHEKAAGACGANDGKGRQP
jgi:hypothetical protein